MLKMHEGLLVLLKELDAICRKHGITYYLEGGSLLGAVRHKGFLPWDDDVDLCITRDNFKKLLSVIDQELPANRELYCYERFPGYLRDTVKYTNLDTTVLFRNHILDGYAAGQHIDLFILDPAPSDPKAQEEYKALATVYSELMSPVYVLCDDIADHLDLFNEYLQMVDEKGREYTLNLLREKLFTIEDTDAIDTYCLRWGNRHSFYPKEFFGESVDVEFEGCAFPAPRQYYRFLRAEFGDTWMIIPDEEHQEDHSTFDNYNVPCKTFQADYKPFIDFKMAWKNFSERKKGNLANIHNKRQTILDNAAMNRALQELALEGIISSVTEEVRQWLHAEQYGRLAEYFEGYYSAQLSPVLMGSCMAIRVDRQVLDAAALALVMTGRFGQAQKLIRISGISTQTTEKLLELITDIRACMLADEEERWSDAKLLAEKWIGEYPLQLNLAAFLIRQGIRESEDGMLLKQKTQALLTCYPKSDVLLKLMGDLSKGEEAAEWYQKCLEVTRNGLILMELAAHSGNDM